MKEEWLFPGAMVPVDMETTAALVAEIKRLIDVVGGMALAQPKQKPVGKFAKFTDGIWREVTEGSAGVPLYTTPPQRKPLSMQERTSIVRANRSFHDKNEIDAYGVIDDVEAAHGIKE